MKTSLQISISQTHSAIVSSASKTASPEATPKLVLDVPAHNFMVEPSVDWAKPQSPQNTGRHTPEQLGWIMTAG